VGLALIEARRGHPQLAESYCERAGALMPRDPELPANLAALHRMVGDALARRQQFAEAAAQYEAALRVQPDDAEIHARLGYALLLLRRPAEAVQQWEEALRLKPDLPGLRARLEQVRRAPAAAAER
jgi:Flp pilus assembly protein TadD